LPCGYIIPTMFELKFRLREHPFYKAWENGEVSIQKLSEYAYSYLDLIENIPRYWQRVLDGFSISDTWIVQEEEEHVLLWRRWIEKLEKPEKYPTLDDLISYLNGMNPSQLLGALHSFEVQQPEIAKFKKECLIKFYNFKESDLTYFDEHMKEEKHINFGLYIYENFADKGDFYYGFERGQELFYRSLDRFI